VSTCRPGPRLLGGNHIYICGGCTPDNRLDLLLIDPVTLDPVSNVVSLSPPRPPAGERRGGLLRARTAVMGNAILTAYQLTFHVHATPGSAAFVCNR
jgi:hypothetical protein